MCNITVQYKTKWYTYKYSLELPVPSKVHASVSPIGVGWVERGGITPDPQLGRQGYLGPRGLPTKLMTTPANRDKNEIDKKQELQKSMEMEHLGKYDIQTDQPTSGYEGITLPLIIFV